MLFFRNYKFDPGKLDYGYLMVTQEHFFCTGGIGYVEDGREIFDEDLEDDALDSTKKSEWIIFTNFPHVLKEHAQI